MRGKLLTALTAVTVIAAATPARADKGLHITNCTDHKILVCFYKVDDAMQTSPGQYRVIDSGNHFIPWDHDNAALHIGRPKQSCSDAPGVQDTNQNTSFDTNDDSGQRYFYFGKGTWLAYG